MTISARRLPVLFSTSFLIISSAPASAQVDPLCTGEYGLINEQDMRNCDVFSSGDMNVLWGMVNSVGDGLPFECQQYLNIIKDALRNDTFIWFDRTGVEVGKHVSGNHWVPSERNRVYFDRQHFEDGVGDFELLFHESGVHHGGEEDEDIADDVGGTCAVHAAGGELVPPPPARVGG